MFCDRNKNTIILIFVNYLIEMFLIELLDILKTEK